MVIYLKLPQRIKTGERGQAAIQMLDEMRRPFLTIKQTEASLLETTDVEASNRALSLAVGSATDLLERYTALARYNVVLSANVGKLSETFENWVAAQRHFFSSFEAASGRTGDALQPASGFSQSLALAALGFLNTMDVLGAGEVPIHADIADGRRATQLLQALGIMLLLYFIGIGFWLQRIKSKRERVLILERVRYEQEAHALQRALSEALAKVLSGLIPICASCKSIRGEDNQWTQVESYVMQKTDAEFTHSICPKCAERMLSEPHEIVHKAGK
ncbi:MAG: hypothetical protein HZA23_06295 [Nitrospirae bacterium]|nr:hypothetical protein [Nitrospirota bacterium]